MEPTLTCCATLLAVYFILATSMFGVGLPSGLRLRVRVRASVRRSRASVVAGLAWSPYLASLTWAPA